MLVQEECQVPRDSIAVRGPTFVAQLAGGDALIPPLNLSQLIRAQFIRNPATLNQDRMMLFTTLVCCFETEHQTR